MTYEELKQSAINLIKIHEIANYVSKDRFFLTAKAHFGIDNERDLENMYGIISTIHNYPRAIANENEKFSKYLPKALEIAEMAYGNREPYEDRSIPGVTEDYYSYSYEDKRRYFYKRANTKEERKTAEINSVDINLKDKDDIVNLAALVQSKDVHIVGVATQVGKIKEYGDTEEKPVFDGDIVFVYLKPSESMYYSWYGDDAGVYIAEKNGGWRKLLYTPGRGYIMKDGELDYENDTLYSDYKISKSGNGFRFVGNIHGDESVLRDKTKK